MIEARFDNQKIAVTDTRHLLESSNLTQSQLSIWLGQQLNPRTPLYSMIRTFSIAGAIDVNSFRQAFQALIDQSDAMRTVIDAVDGVPRQRVLPEFVYRLDFFDFSADENPELTYDMWEADRKQRYLDLERGLFDSALLKLAPDHYIWYLNRHHIITDGASTALIYQKVDEFYQLALRNQLNGLEPLPAFQDYVAYERQFNQSPQHQKAGAYWQDKLANPTAPLRFYGRSLDKNVADTQRIDYDLGPERTQKLRDIATEKGVRALTPDLSIFNIFATLLFIYLHKISGNECLAIGTPFNNRPTPTFKQTIGLLMEMCLLEMEIAEDDTFLSLLKKGLKECFSAFRHTQPGTSSLVSNKTYEVMLNYITAPFAEFNGFPTAYNWIHSGYGDSHHGLRLQVHDFQGAESIRLQFDFNCAVFPEAQRAWAIEHFVTLLDRFITDREQKISQIELVTAAEKDLLLGRFNQTSADYTLDQTLVQHFEVQVRQNPDRIAIQAGMESLSYQQLNERANQLAHHLLKLGLEPETLIGICMERSLEMAVAILGILKAGGAYVPLDPNYPQTRLRFMLEDSQTPYLLTQTDLKDRLPQTAAHIICLDDAWPDISQAPAHNPEQRTTPDSLIYVMYTSGSTGQPKGVMLHHRGIANRVLWAKQTLNVTATDRILQKASFSFDASVWEFFLPLVSGARLVMTRPNAQQDNAYLTRLIEREKITIIHFIPSLLQPFLAEPNVVTACASVRYVWCGGEVLPPHLVQRFYEHCPDLKIINGYGPTEGSINATYELCATAYENGVVPIGHPLSNVQVYILDKAQNLIPIGVPGELHIGGVGVARGYLNQPLLTDQKFMPDPFSDNPDARLYQTGDLARFRLDGKVEFLGRVDHQIKIRGIRIELGEIETTLVRHEAVKEAVVVAQTDKAGDQKLVAYLVPHPEAELETADLRSHLRAHLPEYMLPNHFMFLDKLPLSSTGKLNRQALPAPEQSRPALNESFVEPNSHTEKELVKIWHDVLGIDQIGIHDNFFDLGGHSLSVIKVLIQVRETLGRELNLQRFFETPTVAELAPILETATPSPIAVTETIPKRASDTPHPLSFAQERLWFLDQLEPGSPAYNIHGAVRLHGPLNVAALEASVNALVERHDILRTSFKIQAGETVQLVEPALRLALPIIDLRNVPESEREQAVQKQIIKTAQEPFDLRQPPLLRLELLRLNNKLNDETHILILVLHHIISDEWSSEIFWRELAALYQANVARRQPQLSELPIQYADYAHWQRESFAGETQAGDLTYWLEQLQNIQPLLQLPTDYPRPRQQRFQGGLVSRTVPSSLAKQLRTLNAKTETTMFMTLLAVFSTLLHRYTHQDDIIIGSPIANRNRPESKNLIGLFLNTLALRTNLTGNPRFEELLKQVRQTALDAYAHQEMPFEKLVETLRVERNAGFNPIFQVMFVYQQKSTPLPEFPDLTLSRLPLVDSGTAKFDLTLFVHEDDGGLEIAFEYNSDLFKPETVERMLGHYQTLLEGVLENPQQPVSALPLLTPAERQQILVDWNQTQADFPQAAAIHHLIEAHAQQTPEVTALTFGQDSLSYATLNQRADLLAAHLQRRGVGPNLFVAICMERSLEMFVSILGVLKAGGAYVPLDPGYPKERLRFVLEDTQAPILLTQADLLPQLPDSRSEVISVDREWATIATGEGTRLTRPTAPDDLAYVIYTSGSTGQPKGVPISHRNLVHSTSARLDYYPESVDSFLLLSSFSFDSSLVGIFGTLCQGGTLVLPPQGGEQDVQSIAALVAQHQVSHLLALPSLYNVLLTYAPAAQLQSLRAVMVAGEACPRNLADLHYQTLPATALYNEYGPTEGTVWSTVYAIPQDEPRAQIPIGRPIANMQTYILDAQRQPLPIGVPGELYIGGAGLAQGYLNRPDLTAEKFVPHPFSDDTTARLYRTGDLASYLPDGNIEFLGRIDNQVKIRGYRIELDEIETIIKQQPTVQEAALVAWEFGTDKRLVGYIVSNDQAVVSPPVLQEALRASLPDYMVPAIFVTLEAMPLTPNGKIDRQALPEPDFTATEQPEFVAPESETEIAIAHIWQELLGVSQVGLHDNFFRLGGHSLLVTQLVARLRHTYPVHLPLNTVFDRPTLFALARHIDTLLWATQASESSDEDYTPQDEREAFEI